MKNVVVFIKFEKKKIFKKLNYQISEKSITRVFYK